MGLFDLFKKKPEPVQNKANSVFTLRFTIPYFQIFDKTDPKLKALPIQMGVTGSCQYRISEPDLCFDNVPLSEMSPEQLDAHVKDAIAMNIKTFFNSITTIPLLQFESMIAKISEAAKARLTPIMSEEFGISIRAFSISGVRYDTEDENYLRLQAHSRAIADNRVKTENTQSEIELDELKTQSDVTKKRMHNTLAEEIADSALERERKRMENELEIDKKRAIHEAEIDKRRGLDQEEIDKLRSQKEIERLNAEVDIEKRKRAIDAQAELLADFSSIDSSTDDFDLGGLDDDFKI